jgi:hypothetical protein
MSIKRAQELIRERLGEDVSEEDITQWDSWLWGAWKDSSTSGYGMVLQAAISDEFGARYNDSHFLEKIKIPYTGEEGTKGAMRKYAHNNLGDNAYAKIRAMVRAKWETTQWMLEKADKPMLNLYRGVLIDTYESREEKVTTDHYRNKGARATYTKLPDLHVQRNGAASTSVDIDIANNWKSGNDNHVVLRAHVPRTAVISVPAYGINVHKEREVVVMGTAWVGWDAWKGPAPTIEAYPMRKEEPK